VTSSDSPTITLRRAYADDELAIMRLAALDSAPVPRAPLVLAEVEGELRVAVSVDDLAVIADPFQRTAELVTLVRDHVERSRQRTRHASDTELRPPSLEDGGFGRRRIAPAH
jgi:hypothetical protein